MTHKHLRAELRAAFPLHPIVANGAFEQWGITYPDGMEFMQQLDGRTWEALDPSYLERRTDALSFLGTLHLVAVLPAYLMLLVTRGPSSVVPETLLPLLTDDKITQRQATRFELLANALAPAQRRVVAKVLARYVEDHPASAPAVQAALDLYWEAAGG